LPRSSYPRGVERTGVVRDWSETAPASTTRRSGVPRYLRRCGLAPAEQGRNPRRLPSCESGPSGCG
jgi:hypothetical protein